MKRFPILSLFAGVVVAATTLIAWVGSWGVEGYALVALGMLPLAASIVDLLRLLSRPGNESAAGPDSGAASLTAEEAKEQWANRLREIVTRQQTLNDRALQLQQWLQFPEAIHLAPSDSHRDSGDVPAVHRIDPLAAHDKQLYELIETTTQRVFESIKQDSYRIEQGDRKVFDHAKIRDDAFELFFAVARIYRPDDEQPLLKTNVESFSRAIPRAALRFLVAVEQLPGGLAGYDFQSIYQMVNRAVTTYGVYKAAKPYLEVASNMFLAGRLVSSTNPITLAAWWAAGKATSYGASQLGQHVINAQAVGLIRQLVEIVAVEVASIYSPMVRFRDVHWIYAVELVRLAHQVPISTAAKDEAMRELARLNLRDEYGRVSLMRQLAHNKSTFPESYQPAKSLSHEERHLVVERLESFLLKQVLGKNLPKQGSEIIDWQTEAEDRLGIKFRAGDVAITPALQATRCVVATAAFALEHLGDEPEELVQRLGKLPLWNQLGQGERDDLAKQLIDDPPFLYHPPEVAPESELSKRFLTDLVGIACQRTQRKDEFISELTAPKCYPLPADSRRDALEVTAYYLRSDSADLVRRYCEQSLRHLLGPDQVPSKWKHSPELVLALRHLNQGDEIPVFYADAWTDDADENRRRDAVFVTRLADELVAFAVNVDRHSGSVELEMIARCAADVAKTQKVSGVVRSDCRVVFADGTQVVIPGTPLGNFDAYFAPLLSK